MLVSYTLYLYYTPFIDRLPYNCTKCCSLRFPREAFERWRFFFKYSKPFLMNITNYISCLALCCNVCFDIMLKVVSGYVDIMVCVYEK